MGRRKRWQPPYLAKRIPPRGVCSTGRIRFETWEQAHGVLVAWSVHGMALELSRFPKPCDECRGWHLVPQEKSEEKVT